MAREHKCIETTYPGGTEIQIGGMLTELRIGAINGGLSQLQVTPAPVEEMQHEMFDSEFVRFQVADRVVWMEPVEVEQLVELLKLAHDASLRNYRRAFPNG